MAHLVAVPAQVGGASVADDGVRGAAELDCQPRLRALQSPYRRSACPARDQAGLPSRGRPARSRSKDVQLGRRDQLRIAERGQPADVIVGLAVVGLAHQPQDQQQGREALEDENGQ